MGREETTPSYYCLVSFPIYAMEDRVCVSVYVREKQGLYTMEDRVCTSVYVNERQGTTQHGTPPRS
jgi:hypothetical protein